MPVCSLHASYLLFVLVLVLALCSAAVAAPLHGGAAGLGSPPLSARATATRPTHDRWHKRAFGLEQLADALEGPKGEHLLYSTFFHPIDDAPGEIKWRGFGTDPADAEVEPDGADEVPEQMLAAVKKMSYGTNRKGIVYRAYRKDATGNQLQGTASWMIYVNDVMDAPVEDVRSALARGLREVKDKGAQAEVTVSAKTS